MLYCTTGLPYHPIEKHFTVSDLNNDERAVGVSNLSKREGLFFQPSYKVKRFDKVKICNSIEQKAEEEQALI